MILQEKMNFSLKILQNKRHFPKKRVSLIKCLNYSARPLDAGPKPPGTTCLSTTTVSATEKGRLEFE